MTLNPDIWSGPFRTRSELNSVIEDYVRTGRDQFAQDVAQLEEELRPRAWAAWPRLEHQLRAALHAKLDALWSAHCRRIGGLS